MNRCFRILENSQIIKYYLKHSSNGECFFYAQNSKGGIYLEIKINSEIRNYTESMFFGLSMRQFVFAVIGCGMAVGMYFILKPFFGVETLSWMCMLGAAPFISCGFVTYNGMTAEQFAWVWIKSKFIEPVKVKFECDTLYSEITKKTQKEEKKTI